MVNSIIVVYTAVAEYCSIGFNYVLKIRRTKGIENYLPSEVASGTEVLKVCGEPLIDVTQTQLSIGRLKENCLNHNNKNGQSKH